MPNKHRTRVRNTITSSAPTKATTLSRYEPISNQVHSSGGSIQQDKESALGLRVRTTIVMTIGTDKQEVPVGDEEVDEEGQDEVMSYTLAATPTPTTEVTTAHGYDSELRAMRAPWPNRWATIKHPLVRQEG